MSNSLNNMSKNDTKESAQLPLVKINFLLMAASAVLMLGGSSTGDEFNPDIFSTRRIVVGPTIAFIGFVAMGVSIIYRPRRRG